MPGQSDKQAQFLALAGSLADDFATRAAEHDLNNTFPFENIERLKETGYTALVIPEEHGGLGANVVDYCLCQERLAQGCGATALAINMHLFGLGSMVERGDILAHRPSSFSMRSGDNTKSSAAALPSLRPAATGGCSSHAQ